MATNKHAIIRYHALDQCFGNIGRRYYINNLIEACEKALYEYNGIEEGIKRRQVFDDIKFMESEQGWSIPLERHKDGKKVYYRYSDNKFSIKKQTFNETEAKQLEESLSILAKFKGMPQFDWLEELIIRIESTLNHSKINTPIVAFEQNQYLKGLNYFTELFNAIHYKKAIEINYKGFNQLKPVTLNIHPYFLKQYNSRWFLFGYNTELKLISNLALDRIINIQETSKEYFENKNLNFEEYFDDVIGVTVKENQEPAKIILQISKKLWPYIETKPIHGSQKVKSLNEDFVLIELTLILNYELAALIFSLGEDVLVIEPEELKNTLKTKAEALIKNYS